MLRYVSEVVRWYLLVVLRQEGVAQAKSEPQQAAGWELPSTTGPAQQV